MSFGFVLESVPNFDYENNIFFNVNDIDKKVFNDNNYFYRDDCKLLFLN
jgi:hypothetical protein